jgi:cytidine deaminase
LAAEGKLGIDLLIVVSDDEPPAPPCAVCLQVIAEFARPETEVILISKAGKKHTYKFSDLLPMPFVFPTMR